ncbi:DUF5958 family protein [Nonomuraea sp. NPDC049480]|uniref:DUF5958 family protein n=1 Tax=Nonomuraea sp. NPDC049480 TaxID=3364353 RepID=UPI00379FC1CF
MSKRSIILNELSQGRRPLQEGIDWFKALPLDERRDVIRELFSYALQARAATEDAAESIARAGVKPTATPAVLISRGPIREQLAKIGNLPEAEMEKSFRILLALLSISDARRRELDCADGCTHPWHNLRNH